MVVSADFVSDVLLVPTVLFVFKVVVTLGCVNKALRRAFLSKSSDTLASVLVLGEEGLSIGVGVEVVLGSEVGLGTGVGVGFVKLVTVFKHITTISCAYRNNNGFIKLFKAYIIIFTIIFNIFVSSYF